MKKAIVLHIPVLHEGYLRFLRKHRDTDFLFLPNKELVEKFTPIAKEIRQIKAETMKMIIEAAGLHHCVKILEHETVPVLQKNIRHIITASDSVSLGITEKYFPRAKKKIDPVFLHWDGKSVYSKKPVSCTRKSTDAFGRYVMVKIKGEGMKSSDWWRRVGAAIVKDGKILLKSHNRHVPSEHTPYVFGDPRDFIEAGKDNHLTSALHAEQGLISEAARRGIALEGTDIYVTVFPCPVCAKMIAYSGIKRVFFSSGHASLDGESILKAKKVELIFVK